MRKVCLKGFTLVELLVVIAIIGTLVGLLLPAIQAARESSRRNHCSTNLAQLARAMQMYEDAVGKYPGYINGLGVPHGQATRAPWVVMLFPHLEQKTLWDRWSLGEYGMFEYVDVLVCASNPSTTSEDGPLAYVVNCGEAVNLDSDSTFRESPANGMFFDHSRRADYEDLNMLGKHTADGHDAEEPGQDAPLVNMTLDYIQARGDGSVGTLMMSESIRTVRYGYLGAWLAVDNSDKDEYDVVSDQKYHFGFTWIQPRHIIGENRVSNWEELRINGRTNSSEYGSVGEMEMADGFPSSHHPGGVNGAFAAGQVRFLNERVDQLVYCQLMTTNHKSSSLKDAKDEKFERELKQPKDTDY